MNKEGQYKCRDIRNLQKTAVANVKESERSNYMSKEDNLKNSGTSDKA
jgi:hypothetical protein